MRLYDLLTIIDTERLVSFTRTDGTIIQACPMDVMRNLTYEEVSGTASLIGVDMEGLIVIKEI